jgi:hypothetical protein
MDRPQHQIVTVRQFPIVCLQVRAPLKEEVYRLEIVDVTCPNFKFLTVKQVVLKARFSDTH